MSDEIEIAEGQVWRHKRERYRRVVVTGTRDLPGDVRDIHVRRNTSRRTQAIRETTLRRDYYPTGEEW